MTMMSRFASLSPWLTLVAVIWLQSINGTNSNFSAYSSLLKGRLGITQVQLSHLAVASDAGKLLAWISGIVAGFFPLWAVLAIGASSCFVGYGIQYLFLTNKSISLEYWQVVCLCILSGNGITWVNTACYTATMQAFPPKHHSTAIGLAASYIGLTTKIFSALSNLIIMFRSNNSNADIVDRSVVYLLLNCLVPMGVSLLVAPFVDSHMDDSRRRGGGLTSFFVIANLTGVYVVVDAILPKLKDLPQELGSIMLLLLILLPITVLVAKVWPHFSKMTPTMETKLVGGQEYNVKDLIRSLNFWLYFLVYLCGATLSMVYLNNLAQISRSRGFPETSLLLSISSSFTFFGSLVSIIINFGDGRFISRPLSMTILMIPMAGSFFLLLNSNDLCLIISTAVLGLCSGAVKSISITLTGELFGRKSFRMNHNILILNIPIGSFLFGYVAAILYDEEGGSHGVCYGPNCYHKTFVLWGLICSFGTLLSFVLYRRTLSVY